MELHPEKCPKHFQKGKNKKALIIVDVEERVDSTLYLEGKISCIALHKEITLVGYSLDRNPHETEQGRLLV